MDGWMDGKFFPVFYRTSSPSGPLPKRVHFETKVTHTLMWSKKGFSLRKKSRTPLPIFLQAQPGPHPLYALWAAILAQA